MMRRGRRSGTRRDQIAGHDHQVGLKIVDPLDVLTRYRARRPGCNAGRRSARSSFHHARIEPGIGMFRRWMSTQRRLSGSA